MNDKIGQYVRETMKSYGVSDRKLERELISACRDEYEMQLAGGAYEDEAFRAAVENIEEIAKSRISRRNKFAFALGMGILALCISVLEMLASLLVPSASRGSSSSSFCISSSSAAATAGTISSFWPSCWHHGSPPRCCFCPTFSSTTRRGARISSISAFPVSS